MSALSTLPTLEEVPPVPPGRRLCPAIAHTARRSALRAATIKLFLADEHCSNTVPGKRDVTSEDARRLRQDLSEVPARTPGGIAWKLAEVVTYFEEDDWEPWRYLLRSALVDAIELERARGHCQLGVKHVAEEQESAGNAAARSSFNAG